MTIYADLLRRNKQILVNLYVDTGKQKKANNLGFPGVYTVLHTETGKPFYVGETGNIEQRLRLLFRCYKSKNPHPCHNFYQTAYNAFPTPEDFCGSFHVEVQDTSGRIGRIEIEENLQNQNNTNHSDFYANWQSSVLQTIPMPNPTNPTNPTNHSQLLEIKLRPGHTQYKQFYLIKPIAEIVGGVGTTVYVRFKGGPVITCSIGQSKDQKYINGGEFRREFLNFSNNIQSGINNFKIEIEYWNSNPCLNFQ